VRWNERWRRVAGWEYAASAGLLGGAALLRFAGPEPPDNWRGGVLFDDAIGGPLLLENPSLSGDVGTRSAVLYLCSMAYRFVDSALVPTLGYGDWDLANQMLITDVESFGFVGVVVFSAQLFVGRQRAEYDTTCDGSTSASELSRCQQRGSRFRSFIAGHPAIALTAAGLTCTHHAHVPLYGGWGDTVACGLMVGAAAFTGAGRVMAGKHYPTDLVLGFGLGAFAGWGMPWLLRYRDRDDGQARQTQKTPSPVLVSVSPWLGGSRLGASLVGTF
jgi:hypothetical protein